MLTQNRAAAAAAAAAKSLQSWRTLCDPIGGSPPGSSVPGILQARTLEWVAISFSSASMNAKLHQSYLTLRGPTDSSPPHSSIHRILQARILEWVAISFSKNRANKYQKLGLKASMCMPLTEFCKTFIYVNQVQTFFLSYKTDITSQSSE